MLILLMMVMIMLMMMVLATNCADEDFSWWREGGEWETGMQNRDMIHEPKTMMMMMM